MLPEAPAGGGPDKQPRWQGLKKPYVRGGGEKGHDDEKVDYPEIGYKNEAYLL